MAARIGPTWVVTGAADLEDVLPEGIEVLPNPDWADGQATSLQVAVREGVKRGLDSLVVGLGDQPGVSPAAWRAVASSESPIAVATYEDRPRNPVKLGSSVWELLPVSGDQGARDLIRDRLALVERVPCDGDPTDIDTREDLDAWS